MNMHPQIMTALASEHVRDMRAQAAAARRVREARRARRGPGGGLAAAGQPVLAAVSSAASMGRTVSLPAC